MQEILEILEDIHPEHDFLAAKDFIAEGLLDSFDIVNIVSELEQKFGIVINGEDVIPENFMNIESLKGFVNNYLENHES